LVLGWRHRTKKQIRKKKKKEERTSLIVGKSWLWNKEDRVSNANERETRRGPDKKINPPQPREGAQIQKEAEIGKTSAPQNSSTRLGKKTPVNKSSNCPVSESQKKNEGKKGYINWDGEGGVKGVTNINSFPFGGILERPSRGNGRGTDHWIGGEVFTGVKDHAVTRFERRECPSGFLVVS